MREEKKQSNKGQSWTKSHQRKPEFLKLSVLLNLFIYQ